MSKVKQIHQSKIYTCIIWFLTYFLCCNYQTFRHSVAGPQFTRIKGPAVKEKPASHEKIESRILNIFLKINFRQWFQRVSQIGSCPQVGVKRKNKMKPRIKISNIPSYWFRKKNCHSHQLSVHLFKDLQVFTAMRFSSNNPLMWTSQQKRPWRAAKTTAALDWLWLTGTRFLDLSLLDYDTSWWFQRLWNICQNGNFPQVGAKIRNIRSHHLGYSIAKQKHTQPIAQLAPAEHRSACKSSIRVRLPKYKSLRTGCLICPIPLDPKTMKDEGFTPSKYGL